MSISCSHLDFKEKMRTFQFQNSRTLKTTKSKIKKKEIEGTK